MFGDGLTWTGIISLPYKRDKNGDYLICRIIVQPRLLEVLKDLPVCTGVGVRRDVVGIEEFYSILSGKTVELNGFVDLSAMAAAACYKFRARNITAIPRSSDSWDSSQQNCVHRGRQLGSTLE